MRTTQEILTEISSFQPVNGEWIGLENLLNELWENGEPTLGIDVLLNVFSKYPEEDGAGVFWSIVHGLESLNGYEQLLLAKTIGKPNLFGVVMLGRILNAGIKQIEGKSIVSVLQEISQLQDTPLRIRNVAAKFLECHN